MVSEKLLAILRCPSCAQKGEGLLNLERGCWLVCTTCDRKYPIVDDIPVMLIEEGDKWANTGVDDLPERPAFPTS